MKVTMADTLQDCWYAWYVQMHPKLSIKSRIWILDYLLWPGISVFQASLIYVVRPARVRLSLKKKKKFKQIR